MFFFERKGAIYITLIFASIFNIGVVLTGGFDEGFVDPYRRENPTSEALEMPLKKAPKKVTPKETKEKAVYSEARLANLNKFDQYTEDYQIDPYIKEAPVRRSLELPLEKPPIKFSRGDLEAFFGGKVKIEYDSYRNMNYLNTVIPENFTYFKETLDLSFNLLYGQKHYGHKAFELFLNLRSKNKWGLVGAYKNTSPTEVKLGNISLGEHVHRNSRPNPWFKDAWMKLSFNSILNSKSKKLHFLKIGWFPFSLGRGIAFGPFYATVYEELALFSYVADASAPGINISGEIWKDKLWYDLYYAKFEDNSTSSGATFNNSLKKNHIGRQTNPWRGEAKDDELWATRLKWLAFDTKSKGSLRFEPYIFLNEASDQKVEVIADSKAQFGSYGMQVIYRSGRGKFKMGGEAAANYGGETLRAIDRNGITFKDLRTSGDIPVKVENLIDNNNNQYAAGIMYKAHSHVVINSEGNDLDGKNAPYNDASVAAAENYRCSDSDRAYPLDSSDNEGLLKNKSNRIRPSYKNDFRGWMGVIDARYRVGKNFKIAGEYGYASGDENPHDVEKDKNYDGFVGLHELYAGKRVLSSLLLGQREIIRPTSLKKGAKESEGFRAKNNKTFTDLHYFGLGATWKPERYRKHRFKVNPNLLFFWKAHSSYKYCFDACQPDNSQVSCTEKARRFIGTELNLILNYELLTDLTLGTVLSIFAPGSFYKDIKGVPVGKDYYRDVLLSTVRSVVNPKNYRINDDMAFFGTISLEYKF